VKSPLVEKVWKAFGTDVEEVPWHYAGSIEEFIDHIGPYNCIDAAELAVSRDLETFDETFRYFAGICWRWIKGSEYA